MKPRITALRAAFERAFDDAHWGATKRLVHAALRRRVGVIHRKTGWRVLRGRK